MAAPVPDVTVVVITWQAADLTASCLRSLRAQTVAHRVLVVDNGSDDATVDLLGREFPEADVISLPANTGFAGGVAAAMERVQSRYVALLNNDARAEPDWLRESLLALQDPAVGAVTSRMLLADDDRRINNAGVRLLRSGYGADRGLGDLNDARYDRPAEVFGFSGGAAVLRTLAFRAAGGIDPAYFMYYEDTDASWRMRLADWSIRYVPGAIVRHEHAASSDPASELFAFHTERNRLLTLVRDAPLWFAGYAIARFCLTTASLTVKHWVRLPVPAEQVFLPQLRLRVLGSTVRMLPRTVLKRGRTPRTVSRSAVLRRWRGTDAEVG